MLCIRRFKLNSLDNTKLKNQRYAQLFLTDFQLKLIPTTDLIFIKGGFSEEHSTKHSSQ